MKNHAMKNMCSFSSFLKFPSWKLGLSSFYSCQWNFVKDTRNPPSFVLSFDCIVLCLGLYILYLIASNLIVSCILLHCISLYLRISYHMSFITLEVWSNYASIDSQNVMRVFTHHKMGFARFVFLAFLKVGFLKSLWAMFFSAFM